MENNSKLLIYKGIIQYLLESTNYTLKNIADLSDTSIEDIRSIHYNSAMPVNFISEPQLVRLYHIILTLHLDKRNSSKYIVEINKI